MGLKVNFCTYVYFVSNHRSFGSSESSAGKAPFPEECCKDASGYSINAEDLVLMESHDVPQGIQVNEPAVSYIQTKHPSIK